MKLLNVMIGKPEQTPAKAGMTGHFKKPADGPIHVGSSGLEGDTICDLENHGGVDQAVYIFGEPDRLWWSQELGHDLRPGYFGENLLISDIESAILACGDIFQIGDVTLEITSPRIPCAIYAAHVGSGKAIKQFYAAERPGAYARVLQTGDVIADMDVKYEAYIGDRLTIAENMRAYLQKYTDTDFLRRALQVPAHYKLRALANERLNQTR